MNCGLRWVLIGVYWMSSLMSAAQWKVEPYDIDVPANQPLWCPGSGVSYTVLVKSANQSGTWKEEWERRWIFNTDAQRMIPLEENWMAAHLAQDFACRTSLGVFYSKKIFEAQRWVTRIYWWDGKEDRPVEDAVHDGEDIHPAWDEKEQMLFFASNRSGGNGGFDLYRIHWNGSTWSQPAHLDKGVNTEKDEKFCSVWNSDLYFSSIKEEGDWEIYKSPRDGAWTLRWQMEAPINSERDDFQWVHFDEFSGGVVSNRLANKVSLLLLNGETPKKKVCFEIESGYRIEWKGATQQAESNSTCWFIPVNTSMSFVLYNQENELVPFGFILVRDETGRPLAQGITNEQGEWGWSYITAIFSPLSLMSTDDQSALMLTIPDHSDYVKEEFGDLIGQVSFELGSSELLEEQRLILDRWADFLKERKSVISIQGFTDAKGSAKFNQKLAFQRALVVQSYLLKKGVSISQIVLDEGLQGTAHMSGIERKVSLTLMP